MVGLRTNSQTHISNLSSPFPAHPNDMLIFMQYFTSRFLIFRQGLFCFNDALSNGRNNTRLC